ncbi:MAG: sulfatase-like hydrolase/transferase [Planctomycetaceae bacterium]
MKRICPRRLFLAFLGLLSLLTVQASGAEHPNILFIYTDDQAPTAAGFAGNDELKTPNLDRLAAEGCILRNAFTTTPVCSPSRAGLAASRYGSELGILDWINPNSEQELGLNPNTVTWMELLQEAGYHTGLFGKWHLGTQTQYHPTLTGYDTFMGILEGGCPPKDPVLEVDGHKEKQSGFTVDLVTEAAMDFIEANKSEPFLVSLHYREPHAAWLPARDEDWLPYRDLDPTLPDPGIENLDTQRVKKMTREYYASVASVDRNVGRVLDLLEQLKLRHQTIVIFTSDHGYHNGHAGLWFKGNAQWMLTKLPEQQWPNIAPKQRPNLFDQALRVPTIVSWPNVTQPNSELNECVTNLDWYPTLLSIAGVELPADIHIHGRDFTPLLKGQETNWNNEFYCEYSMRHGATTDMRGWRTPEWKLIIDSANPGRAELYDLKADPREFENLIDSADPSHIAVRNQLTAKIEAHVKQLGIATQAR